MSGCFGGLADEDGESPLRFESPTAEDAANMDDGEAEELEEAVAKASDGRKNEIEENPEEPEPPELPQKTEIATKVVVQTGRGSGRGKGTGRGRGRPKIDGEATTKDSEQYFKMVASLNLGLGLKIGNVYSASFLRSKCKNSASLKAIEKFMEDRSKLAPAKNPNAPVKKEAKREDPPSVLPVKLPVPDSPARKKARKSSDEGRDDKPAATDRPGKPFVLGQVVWHCRQDGSRILAKVEDPAPTSLDETYRLGEYPLGLDHGAEVISAKHADLRAFEVMDMKNYTACTIGASATSVPGSREPKAFEVGQIVWWSGESRPSWPAKVVELPRESEDQCKIRLFDPSLCKAGSSNEEVLAEPIAVSRLELLQMDKGDLPAFAKILQVVYDACNTQG